MNLENINFDEITGRIELTDISYNLDQKYLKECDIKFIMKKIIPYGVNGFSYYNIDNYIYIFGGFSAGNSSINGLSFYSDKIIGIHKTKFYNNLLRYNIDNNEWEDLGIIDEIYPRALHGFFTYNNKMYLFGGFSFEFMSLDYLNKYKEINGCWPEKKDKQVFKDFYEISVIDDKIITKRLSDLPYTIMSPSTLLINNKLFFIGGETNVIQYSKITVDFIEELNIENNIYNSGSLLFYIDLDNIENFKINFESFFPGIPCVQYNLIEKNNNIFLFSDHTFNDDNKTNFRPNEKNTITCCDNWKYNLLNKKWYRIENNPIYGLSGAKIIDYDEDNILFIGGARCLFDCTIDDIKLEYSINNKDINFKTNIINFNIKENKIGNSILNPIFKYGTISNTYSKWNEMCSNVISVDTIQAYDYYKHYFSDLIFMYNIKDNLFYIINQKLPCNIANPNIIKYNNKYIFISGETNDILFNNRFYGIQSCLCFEMNINIK
jgi:N-acetylneuraminic acid mutarotase